MKKKKRFEYEDSLILMHGMVMSIISESVERYLLKTMPRMGEDIIKYMDDVAFSGIPLKGAALELDERLCRLAEEVLVRRRRGIDHAKP